MLNNASCSAIGKPREKMLGCTDHDFFPKEEADVFWARDEQVFQTGMEDINEESLTPPGGTHRTLLTRKQLYVDPHGNPFIVGIFKDITPLKKAEAVLERTNMVLEGMVRDRTAELQRANAEMQVRISQLDYLNEKGRAFARLLNREEVLEEILATYSGLFPGSPVNVVVRDRKGIRSARQTGIPPEALKALEAFRCRPWSEAGRSIAFGAANPALTEAFPKLSGHLWIPFRTGAGLPGRRPDPAPLRMGAAHGRRYAFARGPVLPCRDGPGQRRAARGPGGARADRERTADGAQDPGALRSGPASHSRNRPCRAVPAGPG